MSETNTVEAVARDLQRAWDKSDTLPPFVFTLAESQSLARAALSVIEGREGWQPIETAPKDGTAIIVTRVNPTGRNPAKIVWWANSTPCGWRWRQRRVIRFAPTHWRLLPEPPRHPFGGCRVR